MKASIAAYSIFSLFDFLRKPLIPQFILALSWSPLLENVQPDIKKAIGRPIRMGPAGFLPGGGYIGGIGRS